jgi:hypothetical protein
VLGRDVGFVEQEPELARPAAAAREDEQAQV